MGIFATTGDHPTFSPCLQAEIPNANSKTGSSAKNKQASKYAARRRVAAKAENSVAGNSCYWFSEVLAWNNKAALNRKKKHETFLKNMGTSVSQL